MVFDYANQGKILILWIFLPMNSNAQVQKHQKMMYYINIFNIRSLIMIATTQVDYNRITFSLPQSMNIALDNLKNEIKCSKSEIIKLAIESYLAQQKKIKLQRAVEVMASEYENSDELTEFTALDSEDFL